MWSSDLVAQLLAHVEVRRANRTTAYGPWYDVDDEDCVPEWVGELIADQIVEQDVGDGQVEQGGSIWRWRKSAASCLTDATLTCCVCGADIRESDDYECITTDHGPDHCCTGCEYTGDEEWPCDD